ncbi:unnamed protein product [Agarophyton chilense]
MKGNFPRYYAFFRIVSVKAFKVAKLSNRSGSFTIESMDLFRARSETYQRTAGQMFSISAQFCTGNSQSSLYSTSASTFRVVQHLYYESVKRVLEDALKFGSVRVAAVFLDVKGYYNWLEDECSDLVYSDNIQSCEITIEHAQFIERVLGSLHLDERRYFIDPLQFQGEANIQVVLQGVRRKP